jgi:isopenicillin N synthase-like dioxygenase
MASAALSQAPPILDFSGPNIFPSPQLPAATNIHPAIKSPDAGTRDQLISQIHAACQDKGFFQLTNTGISPALQKRILSASKQFFALPQAEKSRLDKKTNSYNRGYEDLGSQMLEAGTAPESKEGYYLGRDIPADSEEVKRGAFNTGPNLWPESLGEEFKDVCNEYFEEVYKYVLKHPPSCLELSSCSTSSRSLRTFLTVAK